MVVEQLSTRPASVIASYGDAAALETTRRIAGARVVLIHYERLLADFPFLRPHALMAANPELQRVAGASDAPAIFRKIVDQWFTENAALISRAQAEPSEVNARVVTEGPPRTVCRPPRYGRACIAEVLPTIIHLDELHDPVKLQGGGELDIKGVGVREGRRPMQGAYTDGLLSLPDALQEYMVELLIEAVLAHAGAPVRTLPHYGIIDAGFEGAFGDHSFPAALIVRRSHMRDLHSDLPRWDSEDHYLTVRTEMLLRRYGITSSRWRGFEIRDDDGTLGVYSRDARIDHSHALICCLVEYLDLQLPFVADCINVQLATADETGVRQIVDFGQYSARASFDRPVVSLVNGRPMAWGGLIVPSDDTFARPDPALVPTGHSDRDLLGVEQVQPHRDEWSRSRNRLLQRIASEIAASFRRSELDRDAVGARIAATLENLTSVWPPDDGARHRQ
ncbi:hypothetical protein AB0J82_35020 [Asanoa sp. NPDC049518]|uniref:hypothetical protein n=1 Tax=unclassified Asanoa TaxID=2685164 RepID=UPI00343C6CA2